MTMNRSRRGRDFPHNNKLEQTPYLADQVKVSLKEPKLKTNHINPHTITQKYQIYNKIVQRSQRFMLIDLRMGKTFHVKEKNHPHGR